MPDDIQTLINLFLSDPDTKDRLNICSNLTDNGDGSYSFMVCREGGKTKWKHTIRTEEV